jgi:hypothetical protein
MLPDFPEAPLRSHHPCAIYLFARIQASHTWHLGVGELVHGPLLIRRQTCHKDRFPAIRHPPTCPVATQASGSSFTHSEVAFDKIFYNPPAICCYIRYTTTIVDELNVIFIFIVNGDYKNIEFVWNMNSIAVDLSKVWFRVLEFQGLKLPTRKTLHELKTSLELYDKFEISLILLTSDVIQLTLRLTKFI